MRKPLTKWIGGLCLLLLAVGIVQLYLADQSRTGDYPAPQLVQAAEGGIVQGVARMDSPVFVYGEGWTVGPAGADTTEPADPWQEPSGRMTFTYSGQDLDMLLAVGNYWGYLYVTVDGEPANQIALIPGNVNSQGEEAGYKPFLAPEKETPTGPAAEWVPIHRAAEDGPHQVAVEVWRSWGQTPVRGVAVDSTPAQAMPQWPGIAAILLGLLGMGWLIWPRLNYHLHGLRHRLRQSLPPLASRLRSIPTNPITSRVGWLLMGSGLLFIALGVAVQSWLLNNVGLILLGLAGLLAPWRWTGALLFGLPFYFGAPLPILPGRSLNLIEIGVWGGLVILAAHWLFVAERRTDRASGRRDNGRSGDWTGWAFVGIVGLAFVLSFHAQEQAVALREWRTLFLAAGGFALLLSGTVALFPGERRTIMGRLVWLWILGGSVIALIAIGQYASGQMLIEAEGVNRVRGLYGSPNNLALYLERTAAVALALLIFGRHEVDRPKRRENAQQAPNPQSPMPSPQLILFLLTLPQLIALLLTFSKGALLLAMPGTLAVLGIGGFWLLRRQGRKLTPLWGIVAVAVGMVMGLLPFLGAERFRLLFDFSQGTTGGVRLNLWRSSLAMVLDYPWLGVGPDNFLYAYRSGYILPAAWQDPSLNHPHNFVLDWWTRLGLGGLILAALWIGGGAWRLLRQMADPRWAALSLGALAAITASLAHGLIDASYALPDLLLVWVLLVGVRDT